MRWPFGRRARSREEQAQDDAREAFRERARQLV